ncbi:MAG: hypothetical protein HY674_22285 [Chloroflexi bacterium]|nr:hypothetical protein [Chloroflexota bacterium]
MNSRHQTLALIAMAALTIYVLACRPSFSPDGSKVLFPCLDPETQSASVVLYDRTTRKSERVFALPGAGGAKEAPVLSAQWTPDGKQAVVIWHDEESKRFQVVVLPLGGRNPTRFFQVPEVKGTASRPGDSALMSLVIPPPIVGRHLFLGGESLLRLDLETGEIKTEKISQEGIYLTREGAQVYYFAGEDDEAEVGRLDTEKLTRTPLLQLKAKEQGEEFSPFLAFTKDGARIAVTRGKEANAQLLIYRGRQLEKTIPIGSEKQPMALGNSLWSPDGKTIYAAAVLKPTGPAKDFQFAVCEVPVQGGDVRIIPLFVIDGSKGLDDAANMFFQIALSPDGKTLAASFPFLDQEKVKAEDRALFLINLASGSRKVTRMPIPLAPALKSAVKKE